jgi:uncharacterized protein (UPF0276 family)
LTSSRTTSTSSKGEAEIADAPTLGVGILFNPALPAFLEQQPDAFDFLEVIPDREWIDRGAAAAPRYTMLETSRALLESIRETKPVVCHSIGLSIGSASLFDVDHVDQIRNIHEAFGFAWHSDHLSFSRLPLADHEMHTALALPVSYDEEMLEQLIARVRYVRAHVPCPFLLENSVSYVEVPEQDLAEPAFLNRLSSESGCGILLDLHNVYVNARNHGFAAEAFLGDLDLSRVVELHIAGGDELLGFYTDSHAGPVAPPVWDLLERTLRAAPWIRAITFEFHETSYRLLKTDGIRAELDRARRLWDRFC